MVIAVKTQDITISCFSLCN